MAGRGLGKGLGKGLDVLISPEAMQDNREVSAKDGAVLVKIIKVEPNREQPRKHFDEEALQELADSIRQFGLLQPILVQDKTDHYEIIAGERRWRAAKLAGLKEVPVIIRNYSAQEIVEISLIENIQRQDLNPIEEAQAYRRLLEEFSLKQEEVAEKVSKSRTAVTNSLRLLKLCGNVQQMLVDNQITTGHARALIMVEDPQEQERIARQIVKDKLNVREVEKLVKSLQNSDKTKKSKDKEKEENSEALQAIYTDLGEKLKQRLGTKVTVTPKGKGSGKIEIEFYSHEDLDRLLELIG